MLKKESKRKEKNFNSMFLYHHKNEFRQTLKTNS